MQYPSGNVHATQPGAVPMREIGSILAYAFLGGLFASAMLEAPLSKMLLIPALSSLVVAMTHVFVSLKTDPAERRFRDVDDLAHHRQHRRAVPLEPATETMDRLNREFRAMEERYGEPPCRSWERSRRCDRNGAGGFMGHTCWGKQ